MHVALIKPPNINSSVRGIGVYTSELKNALAKRPGVTVDLINFSDLKSSQFQYDLIHFTYFDLFFLTLPPILNTKSIVTVHDLTPLVFPDGFKYGLRGEIKWQVQKRLLSKSDSIIAVSQCTKKDIIKHTSFPENKIKVIYEAAADAYTIIKVANKLTGFRKLFNLPERYLLYVGDINYNKNISTLIRAFKKVTEEFEDINLILIGKSFQGNIPESINIKKEINEFGLNGRVRMLGFVSQDDLVYYYNLASLYIQPSIYEGFGLPVLEAMSCGTLVICGKNSSFPEIGGNAVIFTDVQNADQFAATTIKSLTLSPAKKDQLRKNGLEQAHKFSWEKAAGETHDLYEKICSMKLK